MARRGQFAVPLLCGPTRDVRPFLTLPGRCSVGRSCRRVCRDLRPSRQPKCRRPARSRLDRFSVAISFICPGRAPGRAAMRKQMEEIMLFICSVNWTDQGVRNVKDAPKRAQAARDLAKKIGVDMKELYLTSGDTDMVAIIEAANGDNVAKFAMAIGAMD